MADNLANEKARYLPLLSASVKAAKKEEQKTAPLVSLGVKGALNNGVVIKGLGSTDTLFPQYGVLGCKVDDSDGTEDVDPILLNTNVPWSAFICDSQGSGKSYTLSCMLEDCLHQSDQIGKLPNPLTGVVFHYDSGCSGGICEAAHLCSLGIPVTVLVSESNFEDRKDAYSKLPGAAEHLKVEVLKLQPRHLNIRRMTKLMAFNAKEGPVPLYMEVSNKQYSSNLR